MPTLLESYGFPYIEAIFYKKHIFTSKLDLSVEVCQDMAYYFNPNDIKSIICSFKEFTLNQKL